MESPDHIFNHTATIFSFWCFVEADFKKTRFVFDYSKILKQQNYIDNICTNWGLSTEYLLEILAILIVEILCEDDIFATTSEIDSKPGSG